MLSKPLNLAKSLILVTNDDGIHAAGLKILEKIARELTDDVWTVAPEIEQRGAGHSLTLRRPLTVRKLGRRRFSVDGTPTDCVMIAASQLIPDRRPDLVLSGVNRGANLGEDVTYSGTVSAALEATLLGIPAIALSQVRDPKLPIKWHTAETYGAGVVRKLTRFPWTRDVLMNVNFPNVTADKVTGIQLVRQGRRVSTIEIVPVRDPGGRNYLWIGDFTSDEALDKGTDLAAVEEGAIAVTPLHLDLTHQGMMRKMKKAFT